MGSDFFKAIVKNQTRDTNIVVVDGNNWGRFRTIGPGASSTAVVDSIDALGVYAASGDPVTLFYNGKRSNWWKIPDGTECAIQKIERQYFLVVTKNLPFYSPSPSKPEDWAYTPPSPALSRQRWA